MWFTDLSALDPTYMLPVCASLTMLASIELGADTGQAMKEQQGNMKVFFRGLSVCPPAPTRPHPFAPLAHTLGLPLPSWRTPLPHALSHSLAQPDACSIEMCQVIMVPAVIIGGIPNGVFMYWITANCFSLCQV